MRKKHTTTRKVNGEEIRVFIAEDGKIYITVNGKDNFTVEHQLIIDCVFHEVHDLTKESYLQKVATF